VAVLGIAGVAVLGLAGGGAYMLGMFEGPPVEVVQRGAPAADDAERVRKADEPAQERAPKVIEAFVADTAASYRRAIELTDAQNDLVGKAEASLLLHLNYGPDPVLLGQAKELVQPWASQGDDFVTRVGALVLLAEGQLDAADTALKGNDPRSRLVRAMVRLRQAKYAEAKAEAEAVLVGFANDGGALVVKHAAALALDEPDALTGLQTTVEANPEHLRLRLLLADTLLERGELRRANELGATLKPDGAASPAHQAGVQALRGRIAQQLGMASEAILRFDQAKELAPADPGIQVERLRALIAAGEVATARSDLEVLTRDGEGRKDIRVLQVELALAAGDADKAKELLAGLGEATSTDGELAYLLGRAHAMQSNLDEAAPALEKARELAPLRVDATIEQAKLLMKFRRADEAVALYDKHLTALAELPATRESKRVRADLELARAQMERERGDNAAAMAALDRAIELHPGHNAALLERGRMRLAVGQRDGGVEDLKRLHERAGAYPGLIGPLGRIYLAEGDDAKLDQLLGGQLEDARASDEVLLLGARQRLRQGNADAARALTDKVLLRSPANWQAQLVRAQVDIARGDVEAALVAIQNARPQEPDAEVELWQGKVLEYNAQPAQAMAYYQRALQVDPSLLEARYLYGRLLAYDGVAKQAVDELTKVTAATEAFPGAWLALGLAHRDLGKPDLAIRDLQKATTLDPTLGEAFYQLGRLHNDRNAHAQTIAALAAAVGKAREGESWVPQAYRMLGRAYAASGRGGEAKDAYTRYLQIAPPNAPGRAEVQRQLAEL
jgi:tetratricopeptide (TPR) repeat protein